MENCDSEHQRKDEREEYVEIGGLNTFNMAEDKGILIKHILNNHISGDYI